MTSKKQKNAPLSRGMTMIQEFMLSSRASASEARDPYAAAYR